jgi:hypothetical protein
MVLVVSIPDKFKLSGLVSVCWPKVISGNTARKYVINNLYKMFSAFNASPPGSRCKNKNKGYT